MRLSPKGERALRELQDPLRMVPLMHLVDREGKLRPFGTVMSLEQWETLQSLATNRRVFVLKARKLGVSTLGALFFLHRSTTFSTVYNTIAVGHEEGACKTINRMWQTAFRGMTVNPGVVPGGLGLPFAKGDTWGTETLTINRGGGSSQPALAVVQAGGRGGGRSFTFHGAMFTEGAFYPQGSSATGHSGKETDEGADDAAVSSVLSSMHDDENARVLWETTANGPRGTNWRMYQVATAQGSDWRFHFFPWHRLAVYRRPVPEGFELRDDERELLRKYSDLTLEALVWRRFKLEQDGYTASRFRKEYPITPMDPFIVGTIGWFDAELVNSMLGAADPAYYGAIGWRVYRAPEPGRRYYAGVDPSGGVGRDQATIVILADDGDVVAVFSSRHHGAHDLAEEAANVAAHYNGARVLCEMNNHGLACLTRLRELRVRLWVNDHGKDLWVDPGLKRAMADWCRILVNAGWVRAYDPPLLQEMLTVREQKTGNIGADQGANDDHFSALYLATWNARDALSSIGDTTKQSPGASEAVALHRDQVTQARMARVREMVERSHG